MQNKKEADHIELKLLFNKAIAQRDSYKQQLIEETEKNRKLSEQINLVNGINNSLKEQAGTKDLEIKRLKEKVNIILGHNERLRAGAISWEKVKLLSARYDWLRKEGLYDFYFQKSLEEIKKFADGWKEEDRVIEFNQRKNQVHVDTSDKVVAIED